MNTNIIINTCIEINNLIKNIEINNLNERIEFNQMNRCIGINKFNKRCRAKTKNNNIYCCESHNPINNDIIKEGCFLCYKTELVSSEILYFKCKHAFHKQCYNEWLEFSSYDIPICLICRNNAFKPINKKKIKILKKIDNIIPLINISNELY